MSVIKEKIIVFLPEVEKQLIINKAQAMNMSVNQFMILAAKEYFPEEDKIVIEIFEKISCSISNSIDKTLAYVKESNSRIEAMENSANK